MDDAQIFDRVHSVILQSKSRAEPHIVAWLNDCDWSAVNRSRWSAHYIRCSGCARWIERDAAESRSNPHAVCQRCHSAQSSASH